MFRAFPILILLVFVHSATGQGVRSEGARAHFVPEAIIEPSGEARFLAINGAERKLLWTVSCSMPLRDCLARADGIVLRLDDTGAPILTAFSPPGARITVRLDREALPQEGLFDAPLDEGTVDVMSRDGAHLLIEDARGPILHTRTSGLSSVVSYLAWVESNMSQTLRDARAWPKDTAELQLDGLPEPVLMRYAEVQRRAETEASRTTPHTKPQTEFAIRAQGGATLFSQ